MVNYLYQFQALTTEAKKNEKTSKKFRLQSEYLIVYYPSTFVWKILLQ
jgi:hypothetical protein